MDKKVEGAWLIHHTDKLQSVRNAANDYEAINFAGKCGLLLSSLAASEEQFIPTPKLEALARAANINRKMELPGILTQLQEQKLIVQAPSGVTILGLTTTATLEHATTIFYESNPERHELAAIELSEKVSEMPLNEDVAKEYVGDICKLSTDEVEGVLTASEQIGFVDTESVDPSRRLFFNGNLFRKDEARKASAICSSISENEFRKIRELDAHLKGQGCISISLAHLILGSELFKKLQSIGLYDVSTVSNEAGRFEFVTKPSAFSKFGNSAAVEDAFDLAKTFVTSLSFGMTQSQYQRGKITMIRKLMQKLLNGNWVGPATAIGQDYKILEMKGVIQVKSSQQYPDRFSMKLLKRDIGRLALEVIQSGDISTEFLLPSASITDYVGPERNRAYERKSQSPEMQHSVGKLLEVLRTDS